MNRKYGIIEQVGLDGKILYTYMNRKYENIKIAEFRVEMSADKLELAEFLARDGIEIVEILTTPATSAFGFSYVIYSFIYREL